MEGLSLLEILYKAPLYRSGLITLEDAFRFSPDIKELERMLAL